MLPEKVTILQLSSEQTVGDV